MGKNLKKNVKIISNGNSSQYYLQKFANASTIFKKNEKNFSGIKVQIKSDGSPVTNYDQALNDIFIKEFSASFEGKNFFLCSEEKDCPALNKFPLFIIDPVDGTRDLIRGTGECALSLAILENSEIYNAQNHGYIWNFIRNEFYSTQGFHQVSDNKVGDQLRGLVSRSEWNANLFSRFIDKGYLVDPMGSIAYKLALLASGKCDYVVSLRPKHIWDIAAGTLLCAQAGYHFYSQGKQVLYLDQLVYEPPLIWANQQMHNELTLLT